MSLTFIDKIFKSALSAGIMLAVSHPLTYNFIENTFSKPGELIVNGCPTMTGHLIHSIVFFVLIFAMMLLVGYTRPDTMRKSLGLLLKYSFYGTLIFFILTSTEIYTLVNNFTNGTTADINGCPTTMGLLLHTFIYFLVVFTVMLFPKDC